MKLMQMMVFIFLLCSNCVILAGTFKGLEPGASTKGDADKILGQPKKEVIKNLRYDYSPDSSDTQRISVTFERNTKLIETINIYPKQTYSKAQYKEWLELMSAEKTEIDEIGNLVEYYISNGISLHFEGPDDTSAVRFFSHFDPASLAQKEPPKAKAGQKNERYYIEVSDDAIEKKDWTQAKNLILEGLQKYPNCAELWHSLAGYYFKSKSEPREVRASEAKRSMFRAYKLNPSGKYAGEMAWLNLQFHKDCTLALSYFKEAESKGYAKERPDVFYWMGSCYENIGMYNSAKTYYRRFLDTAPGHEKQPEAETALSRLQRY